MSERTIHNPSELVAAGPSAGSGNRRLESRQMAKGTTKVVCTRGWLGLGTNLAVSILDVSTTGVRLVVKSALEKGQQIEVSLAAPLAPRCLKGQAKVAWALALADGNYCVGAQFERRLSYRELQHFVRGGH